MVFANKLSQVFYYQNSIKQGFISLGNMKYLSRVVKLLFFGNLKCEALSKILLGRKDSGHNELL